MPKGSPGQDVARAVRAAGVAAGAVWAAVAVLWREGPFAVPFVLGLGAMAAVRAVLALQAVLWAAGWWWIGGLLGRTVDGWPALAAKGRERAGRVLPAVIGAFAAVL